METEPPVPSRELTKKAQPTGGNRQTEREQAEGRPVLAGVRCPALLGDPAPQDLTLLHRIEKRLGSIKLPKVVLLKPEPADIAVANVVADRGEGVFDHARLLAVAAERPPVARGRALAMAIGPTVGSQKQSISGGSPQKTKKKGGKREDKGTTLQPVRGARPGAKR